MNDSIMPTYVRAPLAFVSGKGAWLRDTQGKQYLDALSGIAVTGLGHADPAVTRTIHAQSQLLLHTSNIYRIPQQEALAEKLTEISGMDKVFFGNSGAEANECALKIARLYGNQRNIENPTLIVTHGSFHGRSLATLSATGNSRVRAGFEPLVQGFITLDYNDIEAVKQAAQAHKNIVGVMLEPIQGEGGIRIPDDDYLMALRSICDTHGWLLILDEIQTGNGRTGSFFCYQQSEILPDLVTLAKGLGNGIPIGACLARGEAAAVFAPGNHASTFGGNPFACAVGLTVVEQIIDRNLAARAAELGTRMLAKLQAGLSGCNNVQEIRGKGLMLGIEVKSPDPDLMEKALDKGILFNLAGNNVIRLLPPLTITDEEADQICSMVSELLATV